MSALKDHSISKIHKQACVENEIQIGKESRMKEGKAFLLDQVI